ncbi:MAG: S9 family peptidase [Anaerolineaceae bacterium]|nr:S9 family peptidase [Anaerolineaceae bacterium]MDE0328617.1 S9 family peptidase [Anaerolineaceae bacterium]
MQKEVRAWGTWPGALTPRSLAAGLTLVDVQWDSHSDTLVWLENRGAQGVLVAQGSEEAPRDLTSELSVRAMVGYGGGDFTVAAGQVYFAGPGGRLYRQALASGEARPVTPGFCAVAAPRVSGDGRWLAYVYSHEGEDGLALVDSGGAAWPAKVYADSDFVMQPSWHPEGTAIACITWDQPNMPWDGTTLRLLSLEEGGATLPQVVDEVVLAGDENTAVFQPEFSPDGRHLAYVSDVSGIGQLWLHDLEDGSQRPLTSADAEHGMPAWAQGMRAFAWSVDDGGLYFLRNERGFVSLWRHDLATGAVSRFRQLQDYSGLGQPAVSPLGQLAVLASSARIPSRLVTLDAEGATRVRRRSTTENATGDQLAAVEALTWQGDDGETVHGLYYAPHSERYRGEGPPPLIVMVHGGPTSQSRADYDGRAQFFATRGFAVLDVNYRGSTGYGRAYMQRLYGNWGVCDVEDALSGAEYLVGRDLADRERLVIMGGSAGGFTVYQALVDHPGYFHAGICLYGVANQFSLAMETHKFEARYLDMLLGPLPVAAEIYRRRSPEFQADNIVDPIAIFQGDVDQVVPRNQSDAIVASLRARDVPHEYHVYEGEGHGWRRAETIEAFYNSVLRFLQQYVIFA